MAGRGGQRDEADHTAFAGRPGRDATLARLGPRTADSFEGVKSPNQPAEKEKLDAGLKQGVHMFERLSMRLQYSRHM